MNWGDPNEWFNKAWLALGAGALWFAREHVKQDSETIVRVTALETQTATRTDIAELRRSMEEGHRQLMQAFLDRSNES
jgi:hypothetical protein